MRTPKAPEPTTQRQVIPDEIHGEFNTHVPEGAFGGVSQQNIRDVGENADIFTKVTDQADQFQITAAKNAFLEQKATWFPKAMQSQGMESTAYSPTVEDGQFQKNFVPTAKVALDMANNPRQQTQIQKFVAQQHEVMSTGAQQNIAKEVPKAIAAENSALIKNSLNGVSTVYKDPSALGVIKDTMHDAINQQMDLKGVAKDGPEAAERQANLNSFDSTLAAMVVANYNKDNDPQGAKAYLDGLPKDNGMDKKLIGLYDQVQKQAMQKDATDYWNSKGKFNVSPEGEPNAKAIVDNIQNDPSLSDAQKAEYTKINLAQAGKAKMELDQSRANRLNDFENKVDKIRNQPGATMQQQLDVIPTMGGNAHEQQIMRNYVTKQYTDKSGITINIGGTSMAAAKQAEQHMNIKDDILYGRLTDSTVLSKLATDGVLNPKEYIAMHNLLVQTNKGGVNEPVALARRQINQQARDVYSHPNDLQTFMDSMDKATEGTKNPQDLRDYAKENLEPETKDPSTFWDKINNQKPSFFGDRPETDLQDERLVNSMNSEIGKGAYSAIISSLKKENPDVGTKEFENFLHRLGDVPLSEIGRGKPMNNTMQSIIQWNQTHSQQIPFTPEAISKLTEAHPNGYF